MNSSSDCSATKSVHRAIDLAANAIPPAVNKMATSAHNTVDKIADYAAEASETINEKEAQLKETSAGLVESFRDKVRDNPLAALGIAAATGVLLGWLLRKK